jgi:hypothetical protein
VRLSKLHQRLLLWKQQLGLLLPRQHQGLHLSKLPQAQKPSRKHQRFLLHGLHGGCGGCGVLVGYVDDGAYSYAHSDPAVLSNVLTYKYNKLEEWMNSNRLVINPDKTHLMVMANKKNTAKRKEVTMMAGGYSIKPSESERLLGGQLHQSLHWKLHIRDHKGSLVNQLGSRLNGLKKVCVNASFGTKLMVANGVVMSKLAYLITLWGGAQEYLLSAVQVQQLAAARAVCGFGCWRWSKRKLLDKMGWLSVRQLVFYHTVLQAHKTLKTGVPKPLHQSLTGTYPRNTRGAAIGQIRHDDNFVSQSTFKYRAMQSYNIVPVSVRVGTTATVKRKLKQWIKLTSQLTKITNLSAVLYYIYYLLLYNLLVSTMLSTNERKVIVT